MNFRKRSKRKETREANQRLSFEIVQFILQLNLFHVVSRNFQFLSSRLSGSRSMRKEKIEILYMMECLTMRIFLPHDEAKEKTVRKRARFQSIFVSETIFSNQQKL